VLTPGNLITLLGLGLVVLGLVLLSQKVDVWLAVICLVIGRLADLLDGLVAHRTRTKSPVGEAMDAAVDKLEIILTVIVIWLLGLLPTAAFILCAVHAVYNVGLSVYAHFTAHRIHPTRAGKLATASQWAAIALFIPAFSDLWRNPPQSLLYLIGWVCIGCFVALGLTSSWQYTKELRNHGR
jgi:cardiolipin synthase